MFITVFTKPASDHEITPHGHSRFIYDIYFSITFPFKPKSPKRFASVKLNVLYLFHEQIKTGRSK